MAENREDFLVEDFLVEDFLVLREIREEAAF